MNALQLLFAFFIFFAIVAAISIFISRNSSYGSTTFAIAEYVFIASIVLSLMVAFMMFLWCIALIILLVLGISMVVLV
jgi:hypothetical protein